MKNLVKELVTQRFGKIDPLLIDDYISKGGYKALVKATCLSPDDIIAQIKASGLKGRGGAAFPVGIKMDSLRKAIGYPKYIICNGDEGEPGNFKDRYLMESDPHGFIEGMMICAYAVKAQKGYIFIRGEYRKAIDTVNTALAQVRDHHLLGENILGSGLDFDIEVLPGAGSYVCGEEFALMQCIEGKSARSVYKPPFPTDKGLFGCPTQINNVETFANIPFIVDLGADAFSSIGTESSKGTKLISLCGNINKPGLYEVPFGVTIRDMIDVLGEGVADGRAIKMVQLGGASGPCLPEQLLDTKLDYKELAENGLSLGSGAVIVMDDRVEVLDILKKIAQFFQHESCGKCTPCREGNAQILILLDKFIQKTATVSDLHLLSFLADTMTLASICGLGQAAPTALLSVLRFFPDEFELAAEPEKVVF